MRESRKFRQEAGCDKVSSDNFLFDLIHYVSVNSFFSDVGTGLPEVSQYYARINVSCARTQRSDAGEARTHYPSVSSQAL